MNPDSVFSEISELGSKCLEHNLGTLSVPRQSEVIDLVREIVTCLDTSMASRCYYDLPQQFKEMWERTAEANDDIKDRLGSMVLAYLLSRADHRFQSRSIPTSLTLEFHTQFQRIFKAVIKNDVRYRFLSNDVFLKDLGICRLELYPCGSQLVDQHSGIPRRLAFSGGARQLVHFIIKAAQQRWKFSPYYELHMHAPMISSFNMESYRYCYLLVADLLNSNKDYLGVIGSSWFHDPKVKQISPHLAYLQDIPSEGGAYFYHVGQSPSDVQSATFLSDRKRLYEEGLYSPTSYAMIWPRKKLLAWVENERITSPLKC